MKKRRMIFSAIVSLMLFGGCGGDDDTDNKTICVEPNHSEGVPNIIIDTDLGNSADDALALQMLFKYRAEGKVNLLAVMGGCKVEKAKRLLDGFLHYYKADDVPLAFLGGDEPIFEMVPYFQMADSVYQDGTPWFPSTGVPMADRVPSWKQYRKTLSEAADNSVSIICIGGLTSLYELMESEGDDYSPLAGKALIAQKVKQLDVMAGCFTKVKLRFGKGFLDIEYNVAADAYLAKKVLEDWPTALHILPIEEGMKFPSDHEEVLSDYAWNPQSPMYLIYSHYNEWEKGDVGQYWWDPVTVMHTVEPDKYFDCTGQGVLSVSDEGMTTFEEKADGKAHIICVNAQHTRSVYQKLRSVASWKP